MLRTAAPLLGLALAVLGLTWAASAFRSGSADESSSSDVVEVPSVETAPVDADEDARAAWQREHDAMLDREWPLHGLVTGTQPNIRAEANATATILGWLRLGSRIRLRGQPQPGENCQSGWYEIYPRGYVCAGQGLEVGPTAPHAGDERGPHIDRPLPYRYLFVKEPQVPEYFQLPSREDQRTAELHGARYAELLRANDLRRAERMREGRVEGEPPRPPEVSRFLDFGFFVASNGVEIRSRRRFVRTVRGTYIKEIQLEERTGAQFHGVELDAEHTLPVVFAIRATTALIRGTRPDGAASWEEDPAGAIERLAVIDWVRRERIGDSVMHVIHMPNGEERFVREHTLTTAERRDPPSGIAADEPWVHVDLSSQTAVLYRGTTPIYATLVSSGLTGHDTPVGEFTIRRKLVSDTMADPGSDLGNDRYRIEDVPWTEYFDGSIALHAAFWHAQYGIQRSHGCVNLAPADAFYIFRRTWPEVPEGWHGVSTEGTGFRGSRVVVTE